MVEMTEEQAKPVQRSKGAALKDKTSTKKTSANKTVSSVAPVKKIHNKNLGARGETAAALFLERRGYEIVERNWVCPGGEADIIAQDEEGCLVFVEVKTRSDIEKGFPSESVTAAKRKRYEKIATYYLAQNSLADIGVRFDVVSIVVVAPERAFIRHHINAFGIGE
ncbi:MAG: YraN family protein [Raoultibacter sp.]